MGEEPKKTSVLKEQTMVMKRLLSSLRQSPNPALAGFEIANLPAIAAFSAISLLTVLIQYGLSREIACGLAFAGILTISTKS